MSTDATAPRSGMSRRRLLVGGAGLAGAGAAGALAVASITGSGRTAQATGSGVVPFHGPHQAGIVTPAQDRLYFAAFDVITTDRSELRRLLDGWTLAAAQMAAGREAGEYGAVGGPYVAPPEDTGEAQGLPAANLTITVGVGRSLFVDADGRDRFGLADRLPAALIDLPHFSADALDPARSGGDLCVQACADDPQVAFHAVRNLARMGFGVVSLRWSQLGFGRTSSTSTSQATPRNLFGFKDGTANIKAEEAGELDTHVWVQQGDDPGAEWLAGGSYLVARRINMHIETWDRTSLAEQEGIVGRTKGSGAPLSGGDEFTEPDFAVTGRDAQTLIAERSHVRLAHPTVNGGARMLRRGYNFTDGSDGLGRLDAGLFFIAFVRDPRTQYVPMQTNLSRNDVMMEYLVHTGSALFAALPGVPDDGSLADALLG
ncbi:MAG: deferrochelatase/peroxidase EfeB [Ilumatobacter sp.]|nr:deferrochelatase/peroxidase EfeB [Ilumatobacter sp.]MCB0979204.1 deferrochelatase/peroxidase EfeB [Ilumatobacter sp.]